MILSFDEASRKKKRLRAIRRIAPLYNGPNTVCERYDQSRERNGIKEGDVELFVYTYRRRQLEIDLINKKTRLPREVQRQNRIKLKQERKNQTEQKLNELRRILGR